MQRKQSIALNNFAEAPVCVMTIKGERWDTVLHLSEHQMRLINSRFERQFYNRCREDRLIGFIDYAPNREELELIAKKYGIADICIFSDINLYGIKRLLKVIVSVLYRYPRLRSRMSYLGTHSGYIGAVERLRAGDTAVLKDFGLEYICSEEMAKDLGRQLASSVEPIEAEGGNHIATAVSAFGFFDAILFDEKDYDGYAYIKMVSLLRENERSGFHPKGCSGPESVVYHEVGHMLDSMLSLSESEEFKSFYNRCSERDIIAGLSEYAASSPTEMIAEAFAEYMCSPSPRYTAKYIGELIDKKYKEL